jgi:hypothetical protein
MRRVDAGQGVDGGGRVAAAMGGERVAQVTPAISVMRSPPGGVDAVTTGSDPELRTGC